MEKVKNCLLLGCIVYSLSASADQIKPVNCKDFLGFNEIKQKIISMDKSFNLDNPNCKIVGTKSIFPRKNTNGVMRFETGLQIFLYNDYQLKFICLPGWVCKPWESE